MPNEPSPNTSSCSGSPSSRSRRVPSRHASARPGRRERWSTMPRISARRASAERSHAPSAPTAADTIASIAARRSRVADVVAARSPAACTAPSVAVRPTSRSTASPSAPAASTAHSASVGLVSAPSVRARSRSPAVRASRTRRVRCSTYSSGGTSNNARGEIDGIASRVPHRDTRHVASGKRCRAAATRAGTVVPRARDGRDGQRARSHDGHLGPAHRHLRPVVLRARRRAERRHRPR